MKRKGISLIVLSITILVMAILAATVIIALEDSGIIGRSKNTVKNNNYADEYTRLVVIKNGILTDNLGTITVDEFVTELQNKGIITATVNNGDGTKTVTTTSGFNVIISQNGTSDLSIVIDGYTPPVSNVGGNTGGNNGNGGYTGETGSVTITSAELVFPYDNYEYYNPDHEEDAVTMNVSVSKAVSEEQLTFKGIVRRIADVYVDTNAEPKEYVFTKTTTASSVNLILNPKVTDDIYYFGYYLVELQVINSKNQVLATKTFPRMSEDGIDFTFWLLCLPSGTLITVEEEEVDEKGKKRKVRKRKKIEDLTYDDDLVVWDFDNACFTTTKPLWLKEKEYADEYNVLTFSDGSTLKTIRQHRIFNKDLGKFTYPMSDETPLGTTTFNVDGKEVTLVSKEVVEEKVPYYNVISNYHMNVFAEGILTSCRLSNLYEIKDMKYVKENRELIDVEELNGIPEEYIKGLRLLEQPKDVNRGDADNHGNTLKEYVMNLIRLAKKK